MSDVLVGAEGSTAILTLNRPDRFNAIGGELLGQLIEAVEAADADPEVRAIVTTGAGRGYCVGMDVKDLAQKDPEVLDIGVSGLDGAAGRTGVPVLASEARKVDTVGIGRWVTRFVEVGTPTIAAINGAAAGGGLALAFLHDMRVMSSKAALSPSFATLGLSSEMGITWTLPRLVGHARAFRTLVRGGPIKAEEALDLGLVDEVVEPEDLITRALELAAPFASVADRSVRVIKRQLRDSWQSTFADQLEREWLMQRTLMGDPKTAEVFAKLRERMSGG